MRKIYVTVDERGNVASSMKKGVLQERNIFTKGNLFPTGKVLTPEYGVGWAFLMKEGVLAVSYAEEGRRPEVIGMILKPGKYVITTKECKEYLSIPEIDELKDLYAQYSEQVTRRIDKDVDGLMGLAGYVGMHTDGDVSPIPGENLVNLKHASYCVVWDVQWVSSSICRFEAAQIHLSPNATAAQKEELRLCMEKILKTRHNLTGNLNDIKTRESLFDVLSTPHGAFSTKTKNQEQAASAI